MPPTFRPIAVTALSLTAALLLAACSADEITTLPPTTPVTAPSVLPAGAEEVDPDTIPEPSDDDCDATASLAPEPELPPPGQMPAGSTMAEILERGHLRAGVDQSSYLAGYRDPLTGDFLGFDIDILREVALAIFGDADPDRIRFTVMTNSQRQRAVVDGDVDIVASIMTITCQRRHPENYPGIDAAAFPGVEFSAAYFVAEQRLLVPLGSSVRDTNDLGGQRVCVPRNTTVAQNVAHLDLPGTDEMRLVTVDGRTDCLSLLQRGQVDVLTTDESILLGFSAQDPTVEVVGPGFHDQPYGLAIDKGSPDLTRFVNGVLADRIASGRWQEIFEHWLGAGGVPGEAGMTTITPPTPRYRED